MLMPHGHVRFRPDGKFAKCGGPYGCAHCRQEMSEQIGPTHAEWYAEATDKKAIEAPGPEMVQAGRVRFLAIELAQVSAALRDLLDAVHFDDHSDAVLVAMEVARKALREE